MDFSISLAHAIRFLSIDAIEAASSGHPGMPLGMAEIATVLWLKHMRHDPKNPTWFDRDRFVLSNGHGSMLLYSILHLSGYNWKIQDLKNFRKLGSITPGHPELMSGVETTTGPLGQGFANSVGMALAEKLLAEKYNFSEAIIDHYTYVFVGDGCLMEGISHEAASFAGHHGLGKLIVFWDNNSITIDGPTSLATSDSVEQRFLAYGWQFIEINGHDMSEIDLAINQAKMNIKQPTLIACRTEIGWGSVFAGSEKAHGSPLGAENTRLLRKSLSWQYEAFEIPEVIYNIWDARDKGSKLFESWQCKLQRMQENKPELYQELQTQLSADINLDNKILEAVKDFPGDMATRQASNCFLKRFANEIPGLIGGSADLTSSVLTNWPGSGKNHINYGVREFGMFAIMSGLNLHGGFLAFGGTFLTFIDYGRSAIRMSAMMKLRQIYVLTHDSIGLGEDGPTHQPIEHLSILRATPGIETWRPCDVWETFVVWNEAIKANNPSAIVLSRQSLPRVSKSSAEDIAIGAYACLHAEVPVDKLHAIFIATGSEVNLAIQAANALAKEGVMVRVVSMPCMERFWQQEAGVRAKIIPESVRLRIAIEAGASQSWWRLVGSYGKVIGIDCYGESAPAKDVFSRFGFTKQNIIQTVYSMLDGDFR